MEIKASIVHISWIPWNSSDILYIEIFWTHKYKDEDVLQTCVNRTTSDISINNLTPKTAYILWIGTILKDSKVIYSNQLHFVTLKVRVKYVYTCII